MDNSLAQISFSVTALERYMKDSMKDEQIHIEPEHLFAPGLYVRVLNMPAGSVIVSKIHKTEHFCLALTGRAVVVVGDTKETIVGPRLMKTMPGTQRALYIEEDAVWITFHPTPKTDVDEIEMDIIAKDWNDPILLEYKKNLQLEDIK